MWHLYIDKSGASNHQEWVLRIFERALTFDLRLANDIFFYWKTKSSNEIGRKIPNPELRKESVRIFKSKFRNNPEGFKEILPKNYYYSVYHFCVLYSTYQFIGDKYKPDDWHWFGDLLISAAKIDPNSVWPHILPLVIDGTNRDSDLQKVYEYDEANLKGIFGDQAGEVMKLLEQYIDIDELPDDMKIYGIGALEFARKWLKDNPK